MSTYRERREARAERLRGWGEKREAAGAATYERSREIADRIPFGQPILVGHHSERGHRRDIARIDSAMSQAVDNSRKASEMASRADEIERQAAGAIYADDPDAIEQLTTKIARLEAEREQGKRLNAAWRKEHRAELKDMTAYERDMAQPVRSYVGTNLSGNISRLRKRLERLRRERETGPRERVLTARFASTCETCGEPLERGELIYYNRQQGARCYPQCEKGDA